MTFLGAWAAVFVSFLTFSISAFGFEGLDATWISDLLVIFPGLV